MYACFISYCHGQHELTRTFINQFKQALESSLEPRVPRTGKEVYFDKDRLKPGYEYNEALAQAICKSVCMIVVYSPKYESQPYCVREFEGMKLVEQERRALLGSAWPQEYGMIIPIIFRGDPDKLPEDIRAYRHYCDFTRFTTADPRISKNKKYVEKIEKIAEAIAESYSSLTKANIDLCGSCDNFRLPSEDEVRQRWPALRQPWVVFPSREAQP